jgi:hypothetical protein
MATIPPYVARETFLGQKQVLKARKVVWFEAGRGKVTAFSDSEVGITGKISILTYTGDLVIRLALTDNDPAAKKGSCRLQLNSHIDEQARYEANGRALTVYAVLSDKRQNIAISRCNDGQQTECRLFGHINQTVHLDPT